MVGYDKGTDEKEDERTIILAKANMLIYFSDLLAKFHTPNHLKSFANGALNRVFRLIRSNLGTLERTNDEPYDLILTNPPYVTSGSSSIKEMIKQRGLSDTYSFGIRGIEGLAIEWIINNLKNDGQALVIVPDGMLLKETAMRSIKQNCIVQAIVSLPKRSFYSTPRKTYILVLRKKRTSTQVQIAPVFTYFVSELGESRDSYRFTIEQNDLIEMVSLFNQFKGSPTTFTNTSPRCKIIPFKAFEEKRNWLVEKWWSTEEKKHLGEGGEEQQLTEVQYIQRIDEISNLVSEFQDQKESDEPWENWETRKIYLNDQSVFEYVATKTGWSKSEYRLRDTQNPIDIPVYTAALDPVAYVIEENSHLIHASTTNNLVSFGANGDGSAGTNFVIHERPFYVSADRTVLRILSSDIEPEFVRYKLEPMKEEQGFNHTYKATVNNLSDVSIDIPIDSTGEFDKQAQLSIVRRVSQLGTLTRELHTLVESLSKSRVNVT